MSVDTTKIVFDDLEPIKVEVQIGTDAYTLKEASGDAGVKWHNALTKCFKATQAGVTSADGIAETEPLLVSLCLSDNCGRQVPVAKIKGWPYRLQKALFEKAKEISNLAEDEQTEEQLVKKIELLQEKLDKVREKKGLSESTTNGSV